MYSFNKTYCLKHTGGSLQVQTAPSTEILGFETKYSCSCWQSGYWTQNTLEEKSLRVCCGWSLHPVG